ncbi:MAG TPA: cytochrome d ubiquinol oxidase subunit II [Chthonomonadaceae bacterium]|nr:cytochrome d ubiquinol oxidase subunit II [Chthonomonadaceae bacterium]
MATAWFVLISAMLATYVVLDGFDFGAGILHLLVAKTDEERRTVLAAIGPVWDGNEVWLVASGGILVYAFPRAYSAGLSGFYMPLMMVLWLLMLRGISIEFRSHQENPLWRSFWDATFALSSVLLAIVFGAALGNVIRGVPIEASGFFSGPLFTNFLPGPHPGVLDWYTVLVGVFTLLVLGGHGALYLVYKTAGTVRDRTRAWASGLWSVALVVAIPTTAATAAIRPELYRNLLARPWTWALAAAVAASIAGLWIAHMRKRELAAFLCSAAFLVSILGATAAGLYPDLLTSTLDPAYSLDIANAQAGGIGLRVGFYWWSVAVLLAIGYFTYLFRSFRGKVSPQTHGHY